jgi:ribonuclease J
VRLGPFARPDHRQRQACGYLNDLPDLIDADAAMDLPRGEVLIVATGGQGEPRAALARIADDNHPIKLDKGDVVLFSSRQIPGNEWPSAACRTSLPPRASR